MFFSCVFSRARVSLFTWASHRFFTVRAGRSGKTFFRGPGETTFDCMETSILAAWGKAFYFGRADVQLQDGFAQVGLHGG